MNSWILVADGQKAVLYARQGRILAILDRWENQDALLQDHELTSDRAGSPRRGTSVQAEGSPHRRSMEKFAREVAAAINRRAWEIQSLTLIAGPKTLGELRNALSREASGKVVLELEKNLTDRSPTELNDYLAALLSS